MLGPQRGFGGHRASLSFALPNVAILNISAFADSRYDSLCNCPVKAGSGPGMSRPPGIEPSASPWNWVTSPRPLCHPPIAGVSGEDSQPAKPFSNCTCAAREAGKVSLLASLRVGETPLVWARYWRPGSGAKVSSPGKGLTGPAEECRKVPAPSNTFPYLNLQDHLRFTVVRDSTQRGDVSASPSWFTQLCKAKGEPGPGQGSSRELERADRPFPF